jgi:hypothetical protein
MNERLTRPHRDELAHALSTNAPWLDQPWTREVIDRLNAEQDLSVEVGTVQSAVMLLAELGRVYPGEPLGELATRTAAALQNSVPDHQIPRLQAALDAASEIARGGIGVS